MKTIDMLVDLIYKRLDRLEKLAESQLPPPSELAVLMGWLDLTIDRHNGIWINVIHLCKWATTIKSWCEFKFGWEIDDNVILQYIKDNQELIRLIPKWEIEYKSPTKNKVVKKKKKSLTK
jgi:hypothetical protein